MTTHSIGILGGGISGLSAAYQLNKEGFHVTIYEKNEEPGGVIKSHRQGSWLVEKGPNTLLVREQKVWDLFDELDLTDRIVEPGDDSKKRYIVKNEQLCPAPMSLGSFLKTDLLSASAKFRLLKEPFISQSEKEDESIAGFIQRRLGPEVLDYAVNPFVSGIYAGDPKQLSVKHTFSSLHELEQKHGSIAKGFFKREKSNKKARRALLSLDDGLQVLPQKMADHLGESLQLNTEIEKISRDAAGWSITTDSGETHSHDVLISTIPLHQLHQIWSEKESLPAFNTLKDVDYAPMSVIALGFKRQQVQHPLDGFGMLVPEKEPFSLLGCLFSSSLFPNRVPENHVLITCFMGGARHRDLAFKSTEALIDELMPQLRKLLDIQGDPVFQHHTFWKHAIPQYTIGYDEYVNSMRQIESSNPGFYLAGNYRGGVSVPDCITNGLDLTSRVKDYFSSI